MISANNLQKKFKRRRSCEVSKQIRYIKKLAKQAIKAQKPYCFTYDNLYDETIDLLHKKGLEVTSFSVDGSSKGYLIRWSCETITK